MCCCLSLSTFLLDIKSYRFLSTQDPGVVYCRFSRAVFQLTCQNGEKVIVYVFVASVWHMVETRAVHFFFFFKEITGLKISRIPL